jgi:glycosyltransferase involved in cell wall biosynthesis
MKNKVAFVLYTYPFGVSSMIVNSIKMFAGKGVAVDVYMDDDNYSACPIDMRNPCVRFFLYRRRWPILFFSKVATVLRLALSNFRFFYRLPMCLLKPFYFGDYLFSRWLTRCLNDKYDYVFPVECTSLIAAARSKAKLVYYNMELLDWTEENPIYGKDKKLLKTLEYEALKKKTVEAVVIQSEDRARRFVEINRFGKRCYILPVAAMGGPVSAKGTYLQDKFSISADKKIVLYSGNIMPWAKCLEIVDNVRHWPVGFCLVIHTWRKGAFLSGYGLEVAKRAKGLPVFFSEEYMDYEDLALNLSSADIGLMFYEAIDENFTEILFSSNKLAEYLKAGIPIVTSDFATLKEFVQENGIGFTISCMEELPAALSKIISAYEIYHKNASACYQTKLRFEKFFETFYRELYPTGTTRRAA